MQVLNWNHCISNIPSLINKIKADSSIGESAFLISYDLN